MSNASQQIGCTVDIRYGDKCEKCKTFHESRYLSWFGGNRFCVSCLGKLSAQLTQIRWKASEIGKLSSSAIGSLDLVGIEGIEDALQGITDLSNEIGELLAFTAPEVK